MQPRCNGMSRVCHEMFSFLKKPAEQPQPPRWPGGEMELQSGNIPFLIYLYRNPIGDKEPDGGNRKHNVKSQQDILFHRDKQIGEQHDPHNDPRGSHEGHHKHDLGFFRVKQIGAGQADPSGQQCGADAD